MFEGSSTRRLYKSKQACGARAELTGEACRKAEDEESCEAADCVWQTRLVFQIFFCFVFVRLLFVFVLFV